MVILITNQALIIFLVWFVFAFLGLAMFNNWYKKIWWYDDVIHFASGIVFSIILLDSGFNFYPIIFINLIMAFIWEHWQIKSSKQISWKEINFPEGWGDILLHGLGSWLYLIIV